jgi:hypothetical protein
MEDFGDMVNLLRLVRIPAQVDVIGETLDSEYVSKDCSRDLEIGTSYRYDDTRTTRDVPDFIVLQSTIG